ncbi:MAG TPA: MBL fold metallo-hydrolase [Chloroflexota bacterium]|jgi:L-ascorbate metabolism protein UlaG (beta-lactamase superfamily)|nr:MBL fold metallo-hydrolase [Chloroflexota bacterium]
MEITYVGHSCFRIRGRDATIITDPFSPKFGYTMGRPPAGIVTISQDDGPDRDDHAFAEGVAGEPQVINGPGEYEISNVLIYGVRTHSNGNGTAGNGAQLRLNTVYVIDVDEMRVCHLGELAKPLSAEQVEGIGSINVLMVPVGGGETIGPNQAAQVVSQLEPNIVIPMHYRIEGTRSERLEPVDRFMREMGAKSLTPVPKLSLNAKSGLASEIQVMVMEHKKAS